MENSIHMGIITGADIPVKEREKIRHEVNDIYFPKYEGLSYIAHRSIGLDYRYYIYLLENHGFDDYDFLMRYDNLDDGGDSDDNERI